MIKPRLLIVLKMAATRGQVERREAVSQTNSTNERHDESDDPSGAGLKKELGLASGVSLIVGCMIGSGIFASPKYVMLFSGSVGFTITVWVLCGLVSLLGSLCYIELGLAVPLSGGEYAYLGEAFGPLGAFLFSWTQVLVYRPSSFAIILLTFSYYAIEPIFPGCSGRESLQPLIKLLTALAMGKSKKNSISFCV